jgi:hypothetical protein
MNGTSFVDVLIVLVNVAVLSNEVSGNASDSGLEGSD